MIGLGVFAVSIYPSRGIMIENRGSILFNGKCSIGNDSYLSIGKSGHLTFGENFVATTSLKIVCYNKIEFGDQVICGFECIFMDTDLHKMKYIDGRESPKAYGQIKIGDECWFCLKSIVLKSTILPNKTTVASNSLVNKPFKIPESSIIAGHPAKLVKKGLCLDRNDDIINYPS